MSLVSVRSLSGAELEGAIDALASLRIGVFKAYPYLYAGNADYERHYLRSFANAKHAIIAAACLEDGRVIGCATGSALDAHHAEFSAPLVKLGVDSATTFYFGESVLLPTFRGHGLGHVFFDAREAHARALGYQRACFCAVTRPPDHPEMPSGYTPLDRFWSARGYHRLEGVSTTYDWPEIANGPDIAHDMAYWLREF